MLSLSQSQKRVYAGLVLPTECMCLRHGTCNFFGEKDRAPECFMVYCKFDSKTVARNGVWHSD